MWPYFLCGAVIMAVFSIALPLYGVTEATVEVFDQIAMYFGMTAALATVASLLSRRRRSGQAPVTEQAEIDQAEYVGNIPPKWNIQFTVDLATVPRRPKLPPQSIFFSPPRIAADVAPKAG